MPIPIIPRQAVRDAVARALLLDPTAGQEAAIHAAAAALSIPVEAVRECVEQEQEA